MIVVCPSDQTGCGKYRLIWPAEELSRQGVNLSIERRPKILSNGHTIFSVDLPTKTEVVVFQRPASSQMAQIVPLLQKKGIKVVIDLDDDLDEIHPLNYAYNYYKSPNRNAEFIKYCCEKADLVTVTTKDLAIKYAPHGRVKIIPNCVPDKFLTIESKPNELVTVGWAGFVRTHPEDLQVTHGAVNEAIVKQDARFMAIGDEQIFSKLQIRNRLPNVYVEGASFDEYPFVLSQLDIGIVPLADTPFNHAKSWLKALEYASLGIAPVVSPTPDNMRLVEEGAAYVARSPKAWRESVQSLIKNEGERLDLSNRAKSVASKWTISANAWRWAEAWSTL